MFLVSTCPFSSAKLNVRKQKLPSATFLVRLQENSSFEKLRPLNVPFRGRKIVEESTWTAFEFSRGPKVSSNVPVPIKSTKTTLPMPCDTDSTPAAPCLQKPFLRLFLVRISSLMASNDVISGFLLRERNARDTYYGSVWSIPIHSYGVEWISKVCAIFDFLMTPTG